jgi:ABC-type transport system involved in multi-copper enzyme maturation permease subunit
MKSILRYTILTASRDWLFVGILLLVLLATSTSIFLSSTALVEREQMAAAYAAGINRILIVVGLTLFVCFHVRRSMDNKEVELILSRPISRNSFVFSYFFGFALLAFLVVVPIVIFMLLLGISGIALVDLHGLLFWAFSLYLESLIMVAIAFFASLILSSAVSSVLFCFAFYFMSRIYGFFLISIHNPYSVNKGSMISRLMEKMLEFIGIFIPRFDLLTSSEWIVYGIGEVHHVLTTFAAAGLYIPFVIAMVLYDFRRKQF